MLRPFFSEQLRTTMHNPTFLQTARPLQPLLFSLSLLLGACQTVPPGPRFER